MPLTQLEIEDHVRTLVGMATNRVPVSHWIQALDAAPPEVLAGAVAQLTPQFVRRPGRVAHEAEEILALRESARAVLDARLSRESVAAMRALEDQLVATMNSLETASSRLAVVSIAVGAAIGIAGIWATVAG